MQCEENFNFRSPTDVWPEASPSFPPPTKAFEGRLQRESMGHVPKRRACKSDGRLSRECPMDSRVRGNEGLASGHERNGSSLTVHG